MKEQTSSRTAKKYMWLACAGLLSLYGAVIMSPHFPVYEFCKWVLAGLGLITLACVFVALIGTLDSALHRLDELSEKVKKDASDK